MCFPTDKPFETEATSKTDVITYVQIRMSSIASTQISSHVYIFVYRPYFHPSSFILMKREKFLKKLLPCIQFRLNEFKRPGVISS